MDTPAVRTAVNLALSGKWEEAISANRDILQTNPEDVEALCRLARAYAETGQLEEAKNILNKVVGIDPANQIAVKFLEKLKLAKNGNSTTSMPSKNESFLEEPGKTKLVKLLNPGEPDAIVNLDPGEEVKLTAYSHRVSVVTLGGKYIGRLPDDIGARLKNLIKDGNRYQTLIKCIDFKDKEVTVFIREIEKGPDSDGTPSFPPEKLDYVSFTPPELVHSDIPDTETTEEIPED